MKLKCSKVWIILTVLIFEGFAKRNFRMKISDAQCIPQSNIINVTCTETKSNRVAGLNLFATFTEDVYKMRYSVDLLYLRKKNVWESFFKLNNFDGCEFLAAKFTAPILLIVRNLMRKFSNFPEECPMRKDTVYYIQRMKFDPETFPPYFPEGQFSVNGVLFNDEHVLFDYKIGFQVISKKNYLKSLN